jgi:hypothetical protein
MAGAETLDGGSVLSNRLKWAWWSLSSLICGVWFLVFVSIRSAAIKSLSVDVSQTLEGFFLPNGV